MARTTQNGNGHKALHVTETPDMSHIKNPDVTHEASDVDVPGILKFVLGLTVLTVAVFVLVWGVFRFFYMETEKEPNPGPMAMSEEERLPPRPRLQGARGFDVTLDNGKKVDLEKTQPEAEYRVVRDEWERRLYCKPEDLPPGPCLPIDQAMEKVLEAGLPSRKQDEASSEARLKLPTAASSGRVTDR